MRRERVPAAAAASRETAPSGHAVDERLPRPPRRGRRRGCPRGSRLRSALERGARRQKSSPLVRRIAKEHDVDIQQIQGTGISGRVTKQDILGFIESGARSH